MDAYEATRIVLSRIQSLDPDNAAKIMGLLLIQDHGEKEMIRLAFGPESLLHSVVLKARKDLGLLPPSSPSAGVAAAFVLGRQNSGSRLLGLNSPTSWSSPPVFSRNNSLVDAGTVDDSQPLDELVSPSNPYNDVTSNEAVDDFHLQEQLSFLNESVGVAGNPRRSLAVGPRSNLYDQDLVGHCRSPSVDVGSFSYSLGWGSSASGHRRSCSAAADLLLSSDPAGIGWKPCLYFARGYCKNGSNCRFLHGAPDDTAVAAMAAGVNIDLADEQQCQEVLLRSRSPRQLMASAFPFSPTGSMPASPSGTRNCMSFLLNQQNESQRAAMAAATAAMMLGGADEAHKLIGRSRMMERSEFVAGLGNPGARQIYLTFPADSTFSEEDVSNYFSIYGPVQDVRIPYQQKRMFGFVTFLYPETVKLILAKGNPHFVCDARVLVKPYKEKGKVPDKYRKQQQQQAESGDFSACSTPTGLETRDAFELQQLGSRLLYNTSLNQEMLLKRKLEEQHQAAELQHAIELQRRRFMGLQLLDLKNRNHFGSITAPTISSQTIAAATDSDSENTRDKNLDAAAVAAVTTTGASAVATELQLRFSQQCAVNATVADDKLESCNSEMTTKEEIIFHQSAVEHNLPDSPFASPTKAKSSLLGGNTLSILLPTDDSLVATAGSPCGNASSYHSSMPFLTTPTSAADTTSYNQRFFQMPRFPSDHGEEQVLTTAQGAVSMQ